MRRFSLLIAVMTAALIVPAAHADTPTFTPLPAGTFTDTTCGFDVTVQFSAGETLRVFSNGTVIVSGPLTDTLSANGKTINVAVPGPLIAITGHAVYGLGVGAGPVQLPSGQITFVVVAGQVDLSAFPTLVHGTVLLDVCAALAP
jgi:hypothetical protein